jgi:hypothetical protein
MTLGAREGALFRPCPCETDNVVPGEAGVSGEVECTPYLLRIHFLTGSGEGTAEHGGKGDNVGVVAAKMNASLASYRELGLSAAWLAILIPVHEGDEAILLLP